MQQSRAALVLLVVALCVLGVLGIRRVVRMRGSPQRVAALLEEARGYAIGTRIVAELPGPGCVLLIWPQTGVKSELPTRDHIRDGLQTACGGALKVTVCEAPAEIPADAPVFLRTRLAGNTHLQGIPDAIQAHPDAVACVAIVDPLKPLPPFLGGRGGVPLYALGEGEPARWKSQLQSGALRAVQIESPAGQSQGPRRLPVPDAAAQYYAVIGKSDVK